MLEKFLKVEGVEELSETEQKNITSGKVGPETCYDDIYGYYKC